MSAPKIHFLNVKDGDCSIIERASGRVTLVDISCGNLKKKDIEEARKAVRPIGDYGMRDYPTNPVDYLTGKGISEIWRFLLTHPDMDHMDGVKNLFNNKKVLHFWDCGIRKEKPDFSKNVSYLEEDWDFYEDLISGKVSGTTVITPRAGDVGKYWNADNDEKTGSGDYIFIVAPNEDLIKSANEGGDINDASYVIVYRNQAGNFIFSGDSNDKTWEYVIKNYKDLVSNAAVLFAPHHGRKSGRDYSFLDIVKPRISFFGYAPSEHLAYSAWQYRNLPYFTNNQCGNVHIYPMSDNKVEVFIENYKYAYDYTKEKTHNKDGYWFLCKV